MAKILVYFSFFIILLMAACKPYNSNEVNKSLLQGRWLLEEYDSNENEELPLTDTVSLHFAGDTLTEIINSNYQQKYRYKVSKYSMLWYVGDTLIVEPEIVSLSKDSFVMKARGFIWKYKKREQ